jgi:hypothetical protein
MAQMLGGSVALLVSRQIGGDEWRHVFVANQLVDNFAVSLNSKEGCHVFPLFPGKDPGDIDALQQGFGLGARGMSNLSASRGRAFAKALGLVWVDGPGPPVNDASILGPRDLFSYVYAVLHSPTYRRRYVESLRSDFPKIPATDNVVLFRDLAQLGNELVLVHLLDSPALRTQHALFRGPANPEVGRVGWSDDTVWIDCGTRRDGRVPQPGTTGFHGVSEAVWGFRIGGYQVCEKWLKDRKGRTLTEDDIAHYQKIVVAIAETIRLMSEIDDVIEQHGGWPGAFALVTDDEPLRLPH